MRMFLAFATLFVLFFSSTYAHTHGTITIDVHTFERILKRFDAVLVKFDDKFPFGSLQDGFKGLVESVVNSKDFVIAEVPVTDRDNRENFHFALDYNALKPDFPVYRLFIQGRDKPIVYVGDRSIGSLKRFLLQHTNVWLGLSGTLEVFHRLGPEFFDASYSNDTNKQNMLLEKARELVGQLVNQKEQKNGETYLKIMEIIMKTGIEFLQREDRRIENLLKGRVSKEKKEELQNRQHILQSFRSLKDLLDTNEQTQQPIATTHTDL